MDEWEGEVPVGTFDGADWPLFSMQGECLQTTQLITRMNNQDTTSN